MQNPGEKINHVPLHREERTYNSCTLWYWHHHWFIKQAKRVIVAEMVIEADCLSHKYGIKGLPGLFLLSLVKFPISFPFNFMHLIFKNLVPNLIQHYTVSHIAFACSIICR